MKAVVFTLGCKVNSCESQALIRGLYDRGYEVSEELCYADIYILNTCAVTSEAEKKSRQAITRIKKFNNNAKIIVTGCASEKNPDSFLSKDGVEIVTGTSSKEKILELLDEKGKFIFEPETYYHELPLPKTDKVRSFVKIQDGCNNFCSYCIIPYLRGRSRSRNPVSIRDEIISLNSLECVLTAINLSAYSYENCNLTGLISEIKGVNARIRLGSLEENIISVDFLNALSSLNDFAEHFHLSLQSGCDKTLKKMNRKYTAEEFRNGVKLIREYFPNAGITTDVICGYPTETEKDFNESLKFIESIGFSDIHPFCYSPREGTNSYKLKDLNGSVKQERLNKLINLKNNLKTAFISKNIGIIQDVIIEEFIDGYSIGYTGNYIKVYIKDNIKIGKYKVQLIEPFNDGAIGIVKE